MAQDQAKPQVDWNEVMTDKAVTNISGWTEPNCDEPCNEDEYRQRLKNNAPIIHKKIMEALKFE